MRLRGWRWLAVVGVAASLAALPPIVNLLPAAESGLTAARLLRKIVSSGAVPYEGLAESNTGLRFPDFERAQRVIELFGEKTSMRVWRLDEARWRVDELGPIGEYGTYSKARGLWLWNSGRRAATWVEGESPVRFARAADLLPPELGRRLASAAAPNEVSRLPSRRVAGVHAAGLRIDPSSAATTVDHVDMWADPASGIVVAVDVFSEAAGAIVSCRFLDLSLTAPSADVLRFAPPPDAEVSTTRVPDFAHAVARYSPFVLPDQIGALPRRKSVARAVGTYGQGFDLVAALVLHARYLPFRDDELDRIPVVRGRFGTGRLLRTPLLNALFVERGSIAYLIGGSVKIGMLRRVAADLVRSIESGTEPDVP